MIAKSYDFGMTISGWIGDEGSRHADPPRRRAWHMPRPRPREPRARAHVVFAALCTLGLTARVASQCANGRTDPHLSFAPGGRADFRGRNGAYYSFLSTPGFLDKRAD